MKNTIPKKELIDWFQLYSAKRPNKEIVYKKNPCFGKKIPVWIIYISYKKEYIWVYLIRSYNNYLKYII